MRIALIGAHVVQVIRQHQREPHFGGETEELLVEATLFGEAVILHFEEEAPLPKDFAVLPRQSARVLPVVNLQGASDLAVQASRESNKALGMPRKMVVVGTWLVVEPIKVGVGHDPAEIAIARATGREGDEVERLLVGLPLFVAHPTAGDVRLNADDRLNPKLHCRLHELDRAVEGAVVGEGDRVHPKALRLLHQRLQVAHAVEQAELAVDVEVRKVRLGAHVGQSSDRRTIPLWMSRNAHDYGQP